MPIAIAVAAVVALVDSGGQAALIAPQAPVLPRWEVRPIPEFPQAAMSRGRFQGSVVLSCFIEPDRHLRNCDVVSEPPRQFGFGSAALESARAAVLDEGFVLEHGLEEPITFTIRFSTGG